MNLQRVCVKVFADPSAHFDERVLIDVFHDWFRRGAALGTLIDVADYRHVPNGPGVMLITHEGNYALDRSGGRPGLTYQRKAALPGDVGARLRSAARHVLTACRLLEGEARVGADLVFAAGQVEVIANDRLLAPNTDEAYGALEPHLRALGETLYGPGHFELQRVANDPHERLAAMVTGDAQVDVASVLGRLADGAG